MNRDRICGGYISSSSRGGSSSSPLPTITNSRSTRRFQSMELDTSDIDCGHLHDSSARGQIMRRQNSRAYPMQSVAFGPISASRTVPNENYGFLVCSVGAFERSAGEVTCTASISISVPTVRGGIGRRPSRASFLSLFRPFFRVVDFCASMHLHGQKRNSY